MLGAKAESDAYYNLVTDLAPKIGNLKGYEYSYTLPSSGMMVISHNGVNFLITAEALSKTEDMTVGEELNRQRFRIVARDKEQEKRINKEREEDDGK